MQTELAQMRETLHALLPEKSFLKRDRGDALFVTNAPVFDPSITSIPGFVLIPCGNLMRILPDAEWIAELEQRNEAPDHLCASLIRFRGAKAGKENLCLYAQGLKLFDMGASAPANETEAYDRSLRRRAALALRGAACGGGLYAAALLSHQIHKENEI